MATTLYDMSVPTFLQTARAVSGFLQKAATHCQQTGTDPDDFATARLYPDMAQFWFQIECVDNFSVWGLEAMRTGAFTLRRLSDQPHMRICRTGSRRQ